MDVGCGDGLEELGHAFHDWARAFRYSCLLKLQDKVERIHKAREMEGRPVPIPPRYLVPLLQSASIEDDDAIQELWAGLIANATDPNTTQEPSRVLIDILSSMDPLDALLIKHIHERVPYGFSVDAEILASDLMCDREQLMLSLSNLSRLGCFEYINDTGAVYVTHGSSGLEAPTVQFKEYRFRMTPLAETLLCACAVSR